jgi:uridine kinase
MSHKSLISFLLRYEMNVLDAPESPILARRLERDVKSRGYSVERVMRLFPELKRDSEKFIEPARGVAVIVHVWSFFRDSLESEFHQKAEEEYPISEESSYWQHSEGTM